MFEGVRRVQCTFEGIRGVQHKGNPLHEGGLFTDQAYLLQQWPSRLQCHLCLHAKYHLGLRRFNMVSRACLILGNPAN